MILGTIFILLIISKASILLQLPNTTHAAAAPSFSLYEKVHLANDTYTVIGNDGTNVKLLMDKTIGNAQVWGTTASTIRNYPSASTLGGTGYGLLNWKLNLPASSDLTSVTANNKLNASIPSVTGDWWLGDVTVDNRNKFMTSDNRNDGTTTLTTAKQDQTTGECGSETSTLIGEKLTTKKTDKDLSANIKTGRDIITVKGKATVGGSIEAYTSSDCTGNNVGINNRKIPTSETQATVYYDGTKYITNETSPGNTDEKRGLVYLYTIMKSFGVELVKAGDMYSSGEAQVGYCSVYKTPLVPDGLSTIVKSWKITKKDSNVPMTFTLEVVSNVEETEEKTCTGATNEAGTALVRPMVTYPISGVVFANSTKRRFTPGNTLSGSFPVSSSGTNKPFVTLRTNAKIWLDGTASGVFNNTYTVEVPSDGILNLPVQMNTSTDGDTYVSASAEIDGKTQYGVLKKVTGNVKDTVQIDLHQFASNPNKLTQINLKLYLEESGTYKTSYMSEGKDVVVNFTKSKTPQTISFDTTNPTTAEFDSLTTITAKLDTALDKQSSEAIKFSIVSGSVTIDSQSYDASTGFATAKIKPTSGTGTAVIAINKAGDDNATAAAQQTYSLNLSKKKITVSPDYTKKIYSVGDNIPTILSKSSDGTTVPTTLIPNFEPIGDSATSPFANGKIAEIGSWKLVYPSNILDGLSDFTAKYDITLQDYDDNTDYIFETEMSDIPDSWISITPQPNAQGWNLDTVTLAPSDDAIAKGFTIIELVNDAGTALESGATITHSNETTVSGVTLKVQLKKGDYTSNTVTTRTIYIDKTKPSASVSIDKENDWASSKKVEITAIDSLSGIQSVSVARDGTAYTPTVNGNVYSFDADTNGTYTITVIDQAGNETTLSSVISKIDASKISIKATPETLSKDAPKQKITIDYDAGTSGVKSLSVYYKATDGEPYTLLDNTLDQTINPLDWYAEMNGYFQFELINNANEKVLSDEIHITQVNPPVPVTQVVAYEKDNKSNSYVCNTWVKHDVTLEITNANTEIDASDQITWEISEDDGATWKTLSSTTFDVTTGNDTSITKTYQFKAKTDKASEQTPKTFTVKIDKSKPDTPVVVDQEKYTDRDWHAKDVTLTINTTPKEHESTETLYVCEGDQSTCQSDPTKWVVNNGTMNFTGNGSHEVYFKVIDEAGNESDITDAVYININASEPIINIIIQNDPLKELLNNATLGFFFQDTVSIDIEVTYGGIGQTGKVYYIIESDETKSEPKPEDARWTQGTSTSITPDTKGKIYVKAVSNAGIEAYDDSVFEVFADATPPIVTLPSDMSTWTNDPKIEVEITDALSGIDPKTVKVKEDSETAKAFTLQNDKAEITLIKNGAYGVTISASDYSGNPTSETMQVMIDTEGPEISEPIADTNGYAQERTLTFDTSDSLSGLDIASVKNSTGSSVEINDLGNGKYSFTITENDTYTITVSDVAGNISTKEYTEAIMDNDGPVIDNVQIGDETEVRPSKSVSFEVSDTPSGVDEVTVTIEIDGVKKTVNVNLPTDDHTYSFTAKDNGTYTITASDNAGNTTTRQVTVSNIDISGIRIVNVSDIGTWVKDSMTVSFEVSSSIPLKTGTPTVTYNGAPVTITNEQGIYSFIATENGTYTIDVEDEGGQTDQEVLNITRIDLLPPVIENISENTTSTEYREPQVISFHIHDYNDTGKTIEGSGLKSGYPKISIMVDGEKKEIALRQDAGDLSKYSFLAEYNGDYIVELQDQVEHELVRETISVDHILREDQVSPIVVKAYNDTALIASGTWVRNSIRFEISGGLDASILEKYQVAVTDGTVPVEADWNDVNKGTNEHELTGDIKGDVYWFRAVPVVNQTVISQPFTVNLDSTPPNALTVKKRTIHSDPISRFINLVSFGNWMKEAQEVSFEAEDNFTDQEDLTYMYYEERNSEKGNWKRYSEPLVYNDTDIMLYVKAIDLAGNESEEVPEELKIDSVPPVINGAKDQNEYKYYYLPRYLSVTDQGSGVAKTTYKKDQGSAVDFNKEVSLKEIGTYEIYASDQADNETSITFKIVPMPELDDIDGSDESKKIIDQIKQEFEEVKDKLDANEAGNYDKWIDDATKKWDSLRKNQLIHEDTTTKVEGVDNTTFDPNTELVVEEVTETKIPDLPHQLIKAYDVYLRKNGNKVQANGKVKVYLPYDGTEVVTLYVFKQNGEPKEISYRKENGYLVFETDELSSYALTLTDKPVEPEKPDPIPDPVNPTPKPNPDDGKKPTPEPKPEPEEPKDDTINKDTDHDGKPDINIDINCDGKLSNQTDINIDTDGDNIPNINIDTKGDGKPNYNIDINGDGKPDVNIGPVVWKTDKCSTTACGQPYCTSSYYKPYLNIDTDHDGLPDINLDLNHDDEPDLNIDLNFDDIPDIDIDSKGDGLPDINVDVNHDGIADINIVRLTTWTPNLDVSGKIKYDTMNNLKPMYNIDTDGDGKPDENLADNTDNKLLLGEQSDTQIKPPVQGTYVKGTQTTTQGGVGGANTSDAMDWSMWWLMLGISIVSFSFTMYTKRKLRS